MNETNKKYVKITDGIYIYIYIYIYINKHENIQNTNIQKCMKKTHLYIYVKM